MKRIFSTASVCAAGVALLGSISAPRAVAQDPVVVPIIAAEAAPIVVKAVTPKPKQPPGTLKFQGYVMNANIAQVTVRAKGSDMAIQTFTLSPPVAAKMQKIIDNGGYQHGDKITVYYDPQTRKAVKIRGKPSRPL